jgi:hypothetical protein
LPIHTNAWPTVCVGAMSARPSRLKSATEGCRMLALGWRQKKPGLNRTFMGGLVSLK